MENNTNLMNTEDYGLSFSEEVNEKIQAVFADTEPQEMRTFAANVLIGNTPARKLNECVGDVFKLSGFHVKDTTYNDGRTGKYVTLFGSLNGIPCAYGSTSDKVYYYDISPDAVKMFYPSAVFPEDTNLGTTAFPEPTTAMMFMPTLEMVFIQPYFLMMKAIAYIVFVIVIELVFELSVYTIFAPLPLVTFASDTTHDVANSFIKNCIATVLQISVIVIMFIVYVAINKYIVDAFSGTKLIQVVILISLGLGVIKSGTWSKKICGIG